MCENGLSGEQRLIEESGCADTQPSRLKVASLMEEQQLLVEIQKPGPYQISFTRNHFAGLGEPFEGVNRFPLLAVGDRFVGQRFCCFITHAQLFKSQKTFLRHFPRFFAQVQFEVNLRKVEMAERQIISVTRHFAGATCCNYHYNCPPLSAAKVIQLRDLLARLPSLQPPP